MALILGVHALKSYLKLICKYELHGLPNKKVSGAMDHGKHYIKVRLFLVCRLLHNRLLKNCDHKEKLMPITLLQDGTFCRKCQSAASHSSISQLSVLAE